MSASNDLPFSLGGDAEVAAIAGLLADGRVDLAAEGGEQLSVLAFDRLLADHKQDEARLAVADLARRFPTSIYFSNMSLAFSAMPAGRRDRAGAFRDDADADVQVVRREGAATVMLAFSGNQHKMSLPFTMMQSWFETLDAHVIYLRDFSQRMYINGIRSLGGDYRSSVEGLSALVASLAPDRVVCQGNSGGGHAALRMGLEIGADAVLALGAQTNPMINHAQQGRIRERLGLGADDDIAAHVSPEIDLRVLYLAAERAPRARLVYSGGHARDVQQAEHMRDVPGVTLEPIGTFAEHGVFYHLLRSGRYSELLDDLMRAEPRRYAGPRSSSP